MDLTKPKLNIEEAKKDNVKIENMLDLDINPNIDQANAQNVTEAITYQRKLYILILNSFTHYLKFHANYIKSNQETILFTNTDAFQGT